MESSLSFRFSFVACFLQGPHYNSAQTLFCEKSVIATDPSGRLLVMEHNLPANVKVGNALRTLSTGLSVFRIGDDWRLAFVRRHVDVGYESMFWMGMVSLPRLDPHDNRVNQSTVGQVPR